MAKVIIKVAMLLSIVFVFWANIEVLDSAAGAISKTNNEVTIKLEMQQMAALVKQDYIDTEELPARPGELWRDAMKAADAAVTEDTGKDKWGNEYRLLPSEKGFYIISAGPDGDLRTKEDNVSFHQSLIDVGYTGDIYRKWQARLKAKRKAAAAKRKR